MDKPNLNLIPKEAEIHSGAQQRAVEIIVPAGTRKETAEKAVRQTVQKWLETLDWKLHLKPVTKVHIKGPYFCPFLELREGRSVYGEDMYLAVARFRSERARLVKSDVVEAGRRVAEEVDVSYQDWRNTDVKALPDDMDEQLGFVEENAGAVYEGLRDLEAKKKDKEAHDERFGN